MLYFKNLTAFILLFLSVPFFVKTLPSALHELLLVFNVNSKIGIDVTSCKTIFESIIKANFEFGLFLVCLLCIILSFILLFRKRDYTKKQYIFYFLIYLCCILFINIISLYAVYEDMVHNILTINVFDQHLIFSLTFFLFFITNIILASGFSILIWFDSNLLQKTKILLLPLIFISIFYISTQIASFIYMWGFVSDTTLYLPVFDNIFSKLGIGILCTNEQINPCNKYLYQMHKDCNLMKDISILPKVPGGPPNTRIIRYGINFIKTLLKVESTQKCDQARQNYTDCMNMFYAENNKNRRNT